MTRDNFLGLIEDRINYLEDTLYRDNLSPSKYIDIKGQLSAYEDIRDEYASILRGDRKNEVSSLPKTKTILNEDNSFYKTPDDLKEKLNG